MIYKKIVLSTAQIYKKDMIPSREPCLFNNVKSTKCAKKFENAYSLGAFFYTSKTCMWATTNRIILYLCELKFWDTGANLYILNALIY